MVWWYGVTSNGWHYLLLLCTPCYTLHYLFPSIISNLYHFYISSHPSNDGDTTVPRNNEGNSNDGGSEKTGETTQLKVRKSRIPKGQNAQDTIDKTIERMRKIKEKEELKLLLKEKRTEKKVRVCKNLMCGVANFVFNLYLLSSRTVNSYVRPFFD